MHDQQQDSRRQRIQFFYFVVVVILIVFVLRLFYLQILNHSYYRQQAQASQLKQYEIPAERGSLYARDGKEIVPLVLNENIYRVVADPTLVTDADRVETAQALSQVIGTSAQDLESQLQADSRYEILASKQSKETKGQVDALALPGIFTNEIVQRRVYVQGVIAPQVLGFVNDAGEGNYGIEQALDEDLKGVPGRVKALTDQNNVPLLATAENVLIDPVDGENVVLTLDVSMQRQVERILEDGLKRAKSKSGSIIVLDSQSGAVRAMATYPTYDPSDYTTVDDAALFQNTAVSTPLEPGSVMKVLTVAAGLQEGAVSADQTYDDPGAYVVDGSRIENVGHGSGVRSVSDILGQSLNTGATWLLMQLGGGDLNEQGRKAWHMYMTERYFFGLPTGIEQGAGAEAVGIVPDPVEGFGLNIKYANTAFGQGVSVTPLQMVSAINAVVNGGTYYSPTLVEGTLDANDQFSDITPEVRHNKVVGQDTSSHIRKYMEGVVMANNPSAGRDGYRVGGKTGTAEVANPDGGYYEDRFNGTYVGYVGGDRPEYTIIVRVDDPKIEGFAGSRAAGPVFSDLTNILIDNFNVTRVSE